MSELEKLQNHLVALEAFLASPAYTGFLAAQDEEIRLVEERILMTPPITENDRSNVLMWFGELETVKENKKTFEVARGTLEARISEITERDNQTATETKV